MSQVAPRQKDLLPSGPLPARVWLSAKEAAGYLGISERQFTRIADEHGIEPAPLSSQVKRWHVSDIVFNRVG